MKTTKLILGLFVFAALFSAQGCTKEEGLGGKAHIHGNVEHDEDHISGVPVSIWYGESDVSLTGSGYDNRVFTDHEGEFEFEELRKGDYFIYASWTDSDGDVKSGHASVTIERRSDEVEAHLDLE